MKKVCLALLMALVGCGILLGWRGYRNYAPELADMENFDPSRYELTYAMQDFKLKPHDRNWTLRSLTRYDETGEMEWEQVYQLDEDGHSYYLNGEDRIYAVHMPRTGFQNVTGYLADWEIAREEYDSAGRITFREAAHPQIPHCPELVRWYYRTDDESFTGDDSVCTFVRTMRALTPPGEKPWMNDENGEPLMESTGYEITNYDRYGNETTVWVDGKCYLKTDADGYLQLVITKFLDMNVVARVDESGRTLWMALYDGQDGSLLKHTVWEYEECS